MLRAVLAQIILLTLMSEFTVAAGPDPYQADAKSAARSRDQIQAQLGLKSNDDLYVIVVGGGRGIGRGFAEYFAQMGARVLIVSPSSAVKSATTIGKRYKGEERILAATVDFSDVASVEAFLHDPKFSKFLDNTHISVMSGGIVAYDFEPREKIAKMHAIKDQGAQLFQKAIAEKMNQRYLATWPAGTLGAPEKAGILLAVSSAAATMGEKGAPHPLREYVQSNRSLHDQAAQIAGSYEGRITAFAVANGIVPTDMTGEVVPDALTRRVGETPAKNAAITLEVVLNPSNPAFSKFHIAPNVIVPGARAAVLNRLGAVFFDRAKARIALDHPATQHVMKQAICGSRIIHALLGKLPKKATNPP